MGALRGGGQAGEDERLRSASLKGSMGVGSAKGVTAGRGVCSAQVRTVRGRFEAVAKPGKAAAVGRDERRAVGREFSGGRLHGVTSDGQRLGRHARLVFEALEGVAGGVEPLSLLGQRA